MANRKQQTKVMWERPWEKGPIEIMENGRYFCCGGEPFFWLGDTAWLLFHKLTLEETYRYLRSRRELGYNVILADFIHTADQKNLAGDYALQNGDPGKPDRDSKFWEHIDAVIKMAEEMGLYMGILPVWGSCLVKGGHLTMDNVDAYMSFILDRYHDNPNIIWIVGGDVRGDVEMSVFRRMGKRMKEDRPDRLVTFHPFGRTSSSLWFHEEDWLDFNLFQSGHRRYDQMQLNEWDDNTAKEGWFGEDNWKYVERDYGKNPKKPVLDGEPSYEWILQGLHDRTQPYWKSSDVRRYAYWSVFAGAAGHVYGHNSIIQFHRDLSVEGAYGSRYLWSEAIHHPGGEQMIHLKNLMEQVGFKNGRSAQEYLVGEQGEKYDYISVFAGENFVLAYTCNSRRIQLSLADYEGKRLAAYWMDPVTGIRTYFDTVDGGTQADFCPPEREDSADIVLVLLTE